MRFLRGAHLRVDFLSARFFHRAHSLQFRFCAGQFLISDLPTMLFFRPFPSLDLDPLFFLLSAPARSLFFGLTPALLPGSQLIFCGQARCLDFSPARFLFRTQAHQLGL